MGTATWLSAVTGSSSQSRVATPALKAWNIDQSTLRTLPTALTAVTSRASRPPMPKEPIATAVDVERYLTALAPEQRAALEALRATLRAAAPGSTETISYGLPTLKHVGRPLVAYGAFKHH